MSGSDGVNQHDVDTAEKIGRLMTGMETLLTRTDKMEKKLEGIVAMTNRWKGATTVVLMVGGALGTAATILSKFVIGKA